MALSNIKNEPQREITESLFGIALVALAVVIDYFGCGYVNRFVFFKNPCPIPLALILFPIVLGLGVAFGALVLYVTHALGEEICAKLAEHGFDPRPKREDGGR